MSNILQINEKKTTLNSKFSKFDFVATLLVGTDVANVFSPFSEKSYNFYGNLFFFLPASATPRFIEIFGLDTSDNEVLLAKFNVSDVAQRFDVPSILFTHIKTTGFVLNEDVVGFGYASVFFNGHSLASKYNN